MNQTQFSVEGKQLQTNQHKTFSFSSASIIKNKMKQIWKASKNQTFSVGLPQNHIRVEEQKHQNMTQNSLNNSFLQMLQKCEKKNSKDYSVSTDVTCFCNGSKDIRIQDLERKLEKKNELIRYLERKRGQKILVSFKKFEEKIAELELENKFLKQSAFVSLSREKQSQMEITSIFNEIQPQQKTSKISFEFQFEGKLQNEIKSCEKIISDLKNQYSQIQYSPIGAPNIAGKKSVDNNKNLKIKRAKSCIFQQSYVLLSKNDENINQFNVSGKAAEFKNKTSRLTTCSSLKNKNCDFGIQTDCSLNNIEVQTEQTCKDLQSQQKYMMELENNGVSLSKLVEEIEVQNQQLRQQLIQLCQKVNHYHSNFSTQDPSSIQSLQSHKFKQISQNYNEILDIFGIEIPKQYSCPQYSEYHQQLLTEIFQMKTQIINLLEQYRKLQKELSLTKDKYKSKQNTAFEAQKIFKLEGMLESLSEIIQCNNREIIGLKVQQINRKFCHLDENVGSRDFEEIKLIESEEFCTKTK